jgi:hypothetical protein
MNKPDAMTIPIYELYSIWYTPFWKEPWFIIIMLVCGGVIICISIYGLYRFIQKRRSRRVLSPFEQCVYTLQSLDPYSYSVQKKSDQFYVVLTAALKQYAQRRLHIEGSYTDAEFIAAMATCACDADMIERLTTLFQGAQYSKFARQDAAQERMHADLQECAAIVQVLEAARRKEESSQSAHQKQ